MRPGSAPRARSQPTKAEAPPCPPGSSRCGRVLGPTVLAPQHHPRQGPRLRDAAQTQTLEKCQPVCGVFSTAGTIVELGALSPRIYVVFSARHAARCPRADTRSDRSVLRAHVAVGAWTGPGPDQRRPHLRHCHHRHDPDLVLLNLRTEHRAFTGVELGSAPTTMSQAAPMCCPDMHSALPAHP
jgi:hypothetical protein